MNTSDRFSTPPLDWLGALISALITWLWIFPEVLVGYHWHDTSEFISASRTLAVAHPPGHPVTLLSTHLVQLLPWGDAASRAHLSSSLWGGIGAGAIYLSTQLILMTPLHSVLHSYSSRRIVGILLSGLAAIASVSFPLVRLQLIRAEVYASQWALSSLTWLALIYATTRRDQRGYLIAAFSLGLLGANHTLLTAALILALLPRLLTLKLPSRVWIGSVISASLGLSSYLYLWLRGTQGGLSGWGWITDLNSFWDTVSAKVWQQQVNQRLTEVNWVDNLIRMTAFALSQVGWIIGLVVITLLLISVVRWARSLSENSMRTFDPLTEKIKEVTVPSWGPTLALSILCIACTKLTYPFSEQNPDFSGYLAAAAPALVLLVVTALKRLSLIWVAIALSLMSIGGILQCHNSRPPESRGAETWCRSLTREVPPTGTLWSSFYSTHFICSALWATEGWRTDLNYVFRGHRHQTWSQKRRLSSPQVRAITQLSQPQIINSSLDRFEVERPIDSLPQLWPFLSLVGCEDGKLTSRFLTDQPQTSPCKVNTKGLKKRAWRLLQLGDATPLTSQDEIQRSPITDEDTAYAWALHHEMSSRWLTDRLKGHQSSSILQAIQAHTELRDLWIKQIVQAGWTGVDFSSADP